MTAGDANVNATFASTSRTLDCWGDNQTNQVSSGLYASFWRDNELAVARFCFKCVVSPCLSDATLHHSPKTQKCERPHTDGTYTRHS